MTGPSGRLESGTCAVAQEAIDDVTPEAHKRALLALPDFDAGDAAIRSGGEDRDAFHTKDARHLIRGQQGFFVCEVGPILHDDNSSGARARPVSREPIPLNRHRRIQSRPHTTSEADRRPCVVAVWRTNCYAGTEFGTEPTTAFRNGARARRRLSARLSASYRRAPQSVPPPDERGNDRWVEIGPYP